MTALRIGVITAVAPPKVTLYLDGDAAATTEALYLDSYDAPVIGDVVRVASSVGEGAHFVLGRVALGPLGHVEFYSAALSAAVNSTSFTTVTGSTTGSFTKVYAATRLKCHLHAGCFVDVGGTQVEWAVRINSTDFGPAAGMFINPSGEHFRMSGVTFAAGVPAGAYTAVIRTRRTAGTGVVTVNTGDPAWLTIDEVWQ